MSPRLPALLGVVTLAACSAASAPVTPRPPTCQAGLDAGDSEALAALDQLAQDPEIHRRHADCYAYEFLVVRRGWAVPDC